MLPQSITFFGSSSVYGQHDTHHSGFVNRFRERCDDEGHSIVVYDLGIPAETTSQLVRRFDDELSVRRTDVVMIQAGTNDSARLKRPDAPHQIPKSTFSKNIEALITMAKPYSNVMFMSSTPVDDHKNPHMDNTYFFNKDIQQYYEVLRIIAKDADIPFLNLFQLFSTYDDFESLLSPDGLHLGPKGHEFIANRLYSFIVENY